MAMRRVSMVMSSRLLHQSHAWTVASLASARPKFKITEEPNLCEEDHSDEGVRKHGYNGMEVRDNSQLEDVMGAFYSLPAPPTSNNQDEDLYFPPASAEDLLTRCKYQLQDLPQPFSRTLSKKVTEVQETQGIASARHTVKILQWNILSQALGTQVDQFVRCPALALSWDTRRWRIIEEIVQHSPDIICLQEVDQYSTVSRALGSIGYQGRFLAKPDSACLYLDTNTGPDGCAIFYRTSQFSCSSMRSKVLEVWGVKTNQVVLSMNLVHRDSRKEVCVATTHLKARQGDLLSTIRNEQGKDVLQYLQETCGDMPVILTGDFNDGPAEPVYETITGNEKTPLTSAYKVSEDEDEDSLEYTSWKIRETGEQKDILDYIFHSPQLDCVSTLAMPAEHQLGEQRLPSLQFASDHLSLVANIQL